MASLALPDHVAAELYDQLRSLARRAAKGGRRTPFASQTTSLVHEAWLRMRDIIPEVKSQGQFAAMAAATVRSVVVDAARRESRKKRGGGWTKVSLGVAEQQARTDDDGLPGDVDVVELDLALADLEKLSSRRARVVELRFFGGLGVLQIAEALGIGERTVESDWHLARAWLRARLERMTGI